MRSQLAAKGLQGQEMRGDTGNHSVLSRHLFVKWPWGFGFLTCEKGEQPFSLPPLGSRGDEAHSQSFTPD